MIEVNNLRKEFGNFVAVDSISLSVNQGEVLGFLGPNGAGKSTTMKMITGFLSPTAGSISVCGHDVASDAIAAKTVIGYLPEGAPAYPDMTPKAFLNFVAEIRGFRGIDKQQRIDAAIEKTNLASVANKAIDTLSKGFKRRVGIAQAIMHDPKVLVMDEPTDGLDPNQKHEVRELIRAMAKEKSIIISTHILEEVHAVCSRAIIIAQGKLLFNGTPAELESRSRYHNAVSMLLATDQPGETASLLQKIANVSQVEMHTLPDGLVRYTLMPKDGKSIIKDASRYALEHELDIKELGLEAGRLDEVFRTITTGSGDRQEALT